MGKFIYTKFILIVSLLAVLSACAGDTKAEYPMDPEDRRRARAGRLTGDGIKLFDGKFDFGSGDEAGANVGIGINSYLWRATLDTLSFMPLASADPFGGVVITDWYEEPKSPGERFKVNVFILDKKLHANAVRVTVFKQTYDKESGWRDTKASEKIIRDLENKILTNARTLRVAKDKK